MSVIIGILTNFAWTSFLEALNYISIGQADLIANTRPMIVGVLAFVCLKEKISKTDIVCMIGAFTGVYLTADIDWSASPGGSSSMVGV